MLPALHLTEHACPRIPLPPARLMIAGRDDRVVNEFRHEGGILYGRGQARVDVALGGDRRKELLGSGKELISGILGVSSGGRK